MQRQFVAPLAAHLRGQGHEVWPLNGEGLSIRRVISPWDVVAVLRLWWWLRRMKIDVLHVQTAKAGGVGRIAAWLARTPRVIYTMHDVPFHDDLPEWRQRLYLRIERLLGRLCQCILVDSAAVKNRAVACQMAPARKIVVIPVGVDTTHFDPARFPAHASPPYVIGTVARLVPEKQVGIVIELMGALVRRGWPLHGLIVGDGPLRASLQSQVEASGWTRCIQFLGDQVDVARWLAQMDVFVLPSRREGLSVAVMEAMSMARPVLVSDLAAYGELVLDEQTGLVVWQHEWLPRTEALLRDPARRARLGVAARAHVQRYYEQALCCRRTAEAVVGS